MNHPLLDRVRRHVARHRLWRHGTRVAAGLSGGSDSVALVMVLRELAAAGDVVFAGAAHLNHQLRTDAGRDAAFCHDLCARLGVPLVLGETPVVDHARTWKCSIEVAGRRARYSFLEDARGSLGADVVAVAHTADDQAETVLLRLLRGAGPRGLRGVLPRRGTVVRPLLECTRGDLRSAVSAHGLTWVDDLTNDDVAVPRNRIRHELLPLLAERFQPAITRVLARTADVVAADDALLEGLAAAAFSRAVDASGGAVRLSRRALAAEPLALARRVARRALQAAGATRTPDLADVERLLAVCRHDGPPAAEVAGLRVERFPEDAVLLIRRPATSGVNALPARLLPVPGDVALPELGEGCRLTAERPIQRTGRPEGAGVRLALKGTVPVPLAVRSRQPGDRIRPVGLGGSKTLQDLLVDRKVARADRGLVPVVTDATGRIVWVVGHAADAEAAAVTGEDDVIVLNFERPAASGPEGS